MAKKTTKSTERPRTALIIPREKFKSQLIEQISQGKQLGTANIATEPQLRDHDIAVTRWTNYNYEVLKGSFNNPDNEYYRSYKVAGQRVGLLEVSRGYNINEPNLKLRFLREKIEYKLNNLESLLERADLIPSEVETLNIQPVSQSQGVTNTVFIIHGHDEEMKRNVQLVLKNGKLNDIVLHEQPDKGRTVIEKLIEEGASASYVIALLSPDDAQEDGSARARQNVVLEIGYFLGKLGRGRVLLLRKGDTVIPSDLQGILYETYDVGGAWKMKLAKEIKVGGLPIDIDGILAKL